MINLLPKEEKDELRSMYRLRISTIALALVALLLGASLILLMLTYITLSVEENDLVDALAYAKEQHVAIGADQKVVSDLRDQIGILMESEGMPPTVSIDRILSHRARGIALTQLEVSGDREVTIQGVADKRTTLTAFVETLRGDSNFSNVASPISSLIAESNAPFIITITLAHE